MCLLYLTEHLNALKNIGFLTTKLNKEKSSDIYLKPNYQSNTCIF